MNMDFDVIGQGGSVGPVHPEVWRCESLNELTSVQWLPETGSYKVNRYPAVWSERSQVFLW